MEIGKVENYQMPIFGLGVLYRGEFRGQLPDCLNRLLKRGVIIVRREPRVPHEH
jgi:hypothetical protein